MNPPSNSVPEFPVESQGIPPVPITETRRMYWSVRRELWENRSIYLAPLTVACVVLFAILLSTIMLPSRLRAAAAFDPAKQRDAVTMPFNAIAGMLIMTAFLVGVFYCLDALHGERRDRSILFWKSLPVSDRTTVLSKAIVPLVVLPLLVFALALTGQLIVLVLSTVRLLGNGPGLSMLWSHVQIFQMSVALFYGLVAIALWHAPLYAWLLLISAWARRATILWAVLPLLAIGAVERIVLGSTHFLHLLGFRVMGWFERAFYFPPKGSKAAIDPLAALAPGKFLSTPGLWLGLVFAAAFLVAAVRLRRNREPI